MQGNKTEFGVILSRQITGDDLFFPDGTLTYLGSKMLPESAKLTILVKGIYIHSGLFIGLAAAVVACLIFNKTSIGYSIRISGSNAAFAKAGGINITKNGTPERTDFFVRKSRINTGFTDRIRYIFRLVI